MKRRAVYIGLLLAWLQLGSVVAYAQEGVNYDQPFSGP